MKRRRQQRSPLRDLLSNESVGFGSGGQGDDKGDVDVDNAVDMDKRPQAAM